MYIAGEEFDIPTKEKAHPVADVKEHITVEAVESQKSVDKVSGEQPDKVKSPDFIEPEFTTVGTELPEYETCKPDVIQLIEAPADTDVLPVKKPKKTKKSKADLKSEELVDETVSEQKKGLQDSEAPEEDVTKTDKLEKPKSPKKIKPQLMKIQETQVNVQKLKIVEPSQKPVNLADIKLKKPKVPQRKITKGTKLPKFKLKSRIVTMQFPPLAELEKLPVIEQLKPVHKENGILSRTIKDAEKVLRTKRRKMKDIDKELEELEKLDMEVSELSKPELEKVDDEYKYERKPKKPKDEKDGSKSLKLGKGSVPKHEKLNEQIKLKKVHKEVPDSEEEGPDTITKTDEVLDTNVKEKQPRELQDMPPFEPYDIDREIPDQEHIEIHEEEAADQTSPLQDKVKPTKQKKKRILPETIEVPIVKGKPKEIEEEQPTDVKFKVKQNEKPEEKPEDIKLKPFTKPEAEDKNNITVIPSEEEKAAAIKSVVDEESGDNLAEERKISKKKKTKKLKDVSEQERDISNQEIPVMETEEEAPQEETVPKVLIADESPQEEEQAILEETPNIAKKKRTTKKKQVTEVLPEVATIAEEDKVTEEIETLEETLIPERKKRIGRKKVPLDQDKTEEGQIQIEKPKKHKKELPKLMTIEQGQVTLHKLKISQLTEKPVNLAEIKLKKPKVAKKKEIKSVKLPKFLLKSRINIIKFPPLSEQEKKPTVASLEPIYKENGILSRNIQEANALPKTKRRKLKDIDKQLQELEKLDQEVDQLKKNH